MQSTRVRVVEWEDPLADLAQARELSGLEFLGAIITGALRPPPMALLLNFRLVEVREGYAVFEGQPGEEHYNPLGLVHGGYAMTMLDSALGCAVQTILPPGANYATTDVHARLLRAITKDTGTIRCVGQLVSATRTHATSEARLTDAAGTLLATGTTACALRRSAPAEGRAR